MKKRYTLVALLISTLVLAGCATTQAISVANNSWSFDASEWLANDSFLSPSLVAPANWNGSIVSDLDGGSSVFFPGWTQLSGNEVDTTASSLALPANDSPNAPAGSSLSFGATINPLDPSALVKQGVMKSGDTLNIIQKGLAGKQRNQWKLSVNVAGKYICSFTGPDMVGGTVSEHRAVSVKYAFGTTHRVTCSLENKVVTLRVFNMSGSLIETKTAVGPLEVINSSDITIGKKPGSTYPGDTFAGTLDSIFVSIAQ